MASVFKLPNYAITYYNAPNNGNPQVVPQQLLDDMATGGNTANVLNPGGGQIMLRYQLNFIGYTTNSNGTPSGTLTYNWGPYNDIVSRCNTQNIPIMLVIQTQGGNPLWAMGAYAAGSAAAPLASTIQSGDTTFTISSGANKFPTGGTTVASQFTVLIENECINVQSRSGNIFTVATGGRGYANTTAAQHIGGKVVGSASLLPTPAIMTAICTAVAHQYNGSVNSPTTGQPMIAQSIQVSNEDFDTDLVSVRDYLGKYLALVAAQAYPAIKAVHPRCSVGVGAVRKTPTQAAAHVQNWMTGFFANGGGAFTDWMDAHYYRDGTLNNGVLDANPLDDIPLGSGTSADTPSINTELGVIASVAAAYGYSTPIRIMETGWGTDVVTQQQQSDYIYSMLEAARTYSTGQVLTVGIWTMDFTFQSSATNIDNIAYFGTYNLAFYRVQTHIATYAPWSSSSGPPPPVTSTLGFGSIYLAETRFGDSKRSILRPLTTVQPVSYTIATSQYGKAIGVTYLLQANDIAPLLLYYSISQPTQFAINGDASIVAPDSITYVPRPVTARTLVGTALLQGYQSMVWNYRVIMANEFQKVISYYNPSNPVVMVTWLNDEGTWVQQQLVLHPPVYGTQTTSVVNNVTLTFTRIF